MFRSPLRYPGGKALMAPFIAEILKNNNMRNVHYVEPYAGGAGAALNLLLSNAVDTIQINDANIGIFSFWRYLLSESDRFIEYVERVPISLEQWHIERGIVMNEKTPSLELGIATFYLSRTNRSGVISAGPIGGSSIEKQAKATYKIDCRFNRKELVNRLRAIVNCKNRITVTQEDALKLLGHIDSRNVFVYLDPPYYVKGKSLYMNHYHNAEHKELFDILNKAKFSWLLSYDDVNEIRSMYKMYELYNFQLPYTVNQVKKGIELMTHSRDIKLPDELKISRTRSKSIKIFPISIN